MAPPSEAPRTCGLTGDLDGLRWTLRAWPPEAVVLEAVASLARIPAVGIVGLLPAWWLDAPEELPRILVSALCYAGLFAVATSFREWVVLIGGAGSRHPQRGALLLGGAALGAVVVGLLLGEGRLATLGPAAVAVLWSVGRVLWTAAQAATVHEFLLTHQVLRVSRRSLGRVTDRRQLSVEQLRPEAADGILSLGPGLEVPAHEHPQWELEWLADHLRRAARRAAALPADDGARAEVEALAAAGASQARAS